MRWLTALRRRHGDKSHPRRSDIFGLRRRHEMARAQALEFPVLLAHCERQVRMATADGLTAGGLKVIEVASTDEALSYLESRNDICLVITEIDMSGCLNGLDLARFVTRR